MGVDRGHSCGQKERPHAELLTKMRVANATLFVTSGDFNFWLIY